MDAFAVYKDIQARTKGQFLIGVVGPVRTGKSTFIRRFLEVLALPAMEEGDRAEMRDQLPLSGSGTLITTVEPKFIPKEAVQLNLGEDIPIFSIMFGDADSEQAEELASATNARVFDGRENLTEAFRKVKGYN